MITQLIHIALFNLNNSIVINNTFSSDTTFPETPGVVYRTQGIPLDELSVEKPHKGCSEWIIVQVFPLNNLFFITFCRDKVLLLQTESDWRIDLKNV